MSPPCIDYNFYETDQGFPYRNFFLMAVTLIFAFRILFFPESVISNFTVLPLTTQTAHYLQMRSLYMGLVMLVYLYSYYRRWHFEIVAFIVFVLAICHLVGDVMNIYSKFTHDSLPANLVFFSLMRFAATVCLFLNTFNAHRAPLHPQQFFTACKSSLQSKAG